MLNVCGTTGDNTYSISKRNCRYQMLLFEMFAEILKSSFLSTRM